MTDAGQGGASAADESDLSSGVPADKRLSELTSAQAMQVCDFMQRSRAQLIGIIGAEPITCIYRALAAPGVVQGMTVNPQACQTAVDACVAALPAPGPAARSFSCAAEDISSIWTSCDLTIGKLERCVTMVKDRLRAETDALTCEQLAHGDAAKNEPSPPAEGIVACDSVFSECPALLGIANLPWPGAN